MKSYIIHMLRHGMTAGNKTGQYVGSVDLLVTTDGIEQLTELKEKYDYKMPDLYFSSPMQRCRQTIEALYGNVDYEVVDDFRECNFGDFEGKTSDELIDLPEYLEWVKNGIAPPNGENNEDFARRVCTAFVQTVREIMKSGKTESVICAHGGVIMTILAVYGLPRQNMLDWMCSNGRGFTIRITPGVWMRTGMFEVIDEFPKGSENEPDLSINPVKQANSGWDERDYDDDDFDDYPFESAEVIWSDIDDE